MLVEVFILKRQHKNTNSHNDFVFLNISSASKRAVPPRNQYYIKVYVIAAKRLVAKLEEPD